MFILVCTVSGLILGNGRFSGSDNVSLEFLLRAWTWPENHHILIIGLCGLLVGVGTYLLS